MLNIRGDLNYSGQFHAEEEQEFLYNLLALLQSESGTSAEDQ